MRKRTNIPKLPVPASQAEDCFLQKVFVAPNGCWLWQGMLFQDRGGYGSFTHRPSGILKERAHRRSWIFFKGPLTPKDVVLHKCDNPSCVNPEHLRKGTQTDNMKDMVRKGRSAKGAAHSQSKLTEEDVLDIFNDNRLQKDIAVDYGISVSTVSAIKNRATWLHLWKQAVRL